MKTYRVAILGCRSRGMSAARAYHAHPRTEVVGLCDLRPELLATLGDELDVSARFTDLDEMIEKTTPDIVAIPTGTEFHHELSLRVLEHGVHIDVEKPMCIDLVQADEVLRLADQKGVLTAVHHQGRVGASLQAIAKAFQAEKIGELRHITASGKGYYGGYGLLNIGTHLLNNMFELTGHCRRVLASALTGGEAVSPNDVVPAPSGMGTIAGEHISAILEFDGNVTAALYHHRFPDVDSTAYSMEILGTEGRMFWKSGEAWWLATPHYVPVGPEAVWEPLELVFPDHFDPRGAANESDYAFADEYVQALDEGRHHRCSGLEGLHVLENIMGIFESSAYGRAIELPQVQRDHPLLRWRQEAGLGPPAEVPRGYPEWLVAEDRRLGRLKK